MYILGITSTISWNTAAALLKDGQLLAAVEEERLVRIKHAPRLPPLHAIAYCLRTAGITLNEVDYIAVGGRDAAAAGWLGMIQDLREGRLYQMVQTMGSAFEQFILEYRLQRLLARELGPGGPMPRWVFLPHHECHAASAYACSGFARANLLTLDGNGEDDAGYLGMAEGPRLRRFEKIAPRDSLGFFYGQVTDLLGFRPHSEEGKTMGLAGWGTPTDSLADLLIITDTQFSIRRAAYRRLWETYRRRPGEPLTDHHRNLAASAQHALEQAALTQARRLYRLSPERRWCLAGGVALNCDMNARLKAEPFMEELFIQPAAHDAGTAIGAAFALYYRLKGTSRFTMSHAYWGPEYSHEEIEAVLRETKVPYTRCSDIATEAAIRLARGEILGWFQGRLELGPRALGNRSILAHPGLAAMKDRVNGEVKHREFWRPFAPSVLAEQAATYFEQAASSPFMLLTFKVRAAKAADLVAATHVDGTARVQTVTCEQNPRFYRLIEQFGQRTGIPAILNTSFNDRGEPLVASPRDALRTFFATGLDALAIGDFLVTKSHTS